MASVGTHEDYRHLRFFLNLLVDLLVWGAGDVQDFGVVFLRYRFQLTTIDLLLFTLEMRLTGRPDELSEVLLAVPPVLQQVQVVLFLH